MVTALRRQTSDAAEFSGRGPSICLYRGRTGLRTRLHKELRCREAVWTRQVHYPASFFQGQALSGGQRQPKKGGRSLVPRAALSDTAAATLLAVDITPTINPVLTTSANPTSSSNEELAVAPAAVTPATAATATAVAGVAAVDGADGGVARGVVLMSKTLSRSSSAASFFEDDLGGPSLEGSFTSSLELDTDERAAEMCMLVADPSGDVQVVCESDPDHPLSLAEAAVYSPPLPPTLLQDIESKLEADLTTIAVTIIFAVGFISLEFGVNDLIEHYFGDSLLSDVVCVLMGLGLVFWVRLSKARLMRFDRWR